MDTIISGIPKEQGTRFLRTAAQVALVGGAVTALACRILGQDYTYPCTVVVLGAFTWLTISLNQSAEKEVERSGIFSTAIKEQLDSGVDAVGTSLATGLKSASRAVTNAGVSAAKTAVLAAPSLGPFGSPAASAAGSSITVAGGSVGGLSDTAIDLSVGGSTQSAKGLFGRSAKS